ncbi:MAG TPA: sensor histidine kinase, partial [Candidatus Coprovivens excrementavium]|nr:sensor histidine kinase [Candidatus Coprovivens excrementavium]
SKKDLPHIFERFYKAQNSSKDSIGIGLSLAKTIIEKDNGYITVDSVINKGTTFTIKYLK